MIQRMDAMKLFAANLGSWLGTAISMTVVKDFLQVACLLASLIVSAASIWWIRRQARSLDYKDRQK